MEPDLFICHASEDKDSFVRPLARLLQRRGLDVWYDEYSLKLGDSIRRSIERGLQSCRFGLVVLSPSFFRKEWPQRELDGLVAREALGTHIILPILHGVSISEVLGYSAPLADRLGISSDEGLDTVVDKILEVVAPEKEVPTTLGAYAHYLLKEIHDQPRAIQRTLLQYLDGDRVDEKLLGPKAKELLEGAREVLIVGAGASSQAGLVGQYWFREIAGVICSTVEASELVASNILDPSRTLAIFISQSGETPEIIEALHKLEEAGILGTCAITNESRSQLASQTDLVIATRGGHEIAVPATKTFTTSLVALLLLVVTIARRRGSDQEILTRVLRELKDLPSKINTILGRKREIEELAKLFFRARSLFVIGAGCLLPIAKYGAYQIAKCAIIQVGSYPGGEIKHGPIALVDEENVTLALVSSDRYRPKLINTMFEIVARHGKIVAFVPETVEVTVESYRFSLPDAYYLVAPILYAVPLQLVAYYVGSMKGNDVEGPRGLLHIRERKLIGAGFRGPQHAT